MGMGWSVGGRGWLTRPLVRTGGTVCHVLDTIPLINNYHFTTGKHIFFWFCWFVSINWLRPL